MSNSLYGRLTPVLLHGQATCVSATPIINAVYPVPTWRRGLWVNILSSWARRCAHPGSKRATASLVLPINSH
jgi:hypothetical protein